MKVEQKRELPFSSQFLKDLVCDINSYKTFVPHCHDSSIKKTLDDSTVIGSLTVKFGPFLKSFTTRNKFDETGNKLYLSLDKGPFSDLHGYWLFDEISESSTQVSFYIDFSFKNSFFDKPFEHAVGYIYSHIMDSFAKEAYRRHGDKKLD